MPDMVDISAGMNEFSPPSKKLKKDNLEWKITFDQTQSLRTLFEVVGNILTRVSVGVKYETSKGAHFLCIDSIDPRHVCMIQARLVCEKTDRKIEDASFCVDSNILNNCLKNIPNHYSVDLEKRTNSESIFIFAYETLSNSHTTIYEVPTLVDEAESMQLQDMNYRYTIEIDLSTLRQIVKMSQQLRSQQIDLKVFEPDEEHPNRSCISILSQGDATIQHNFYSNMVHESTQNTNIMRAVTDATSPDGCDENLKEVYNESYSAQYLNYFLKSMERQIITMKLSPGQPLILHYPLGADRSYICFVLAPKAEDSDE
jgi:hypothetical protein